MSGAKRAKRFLFVVPPLTGHTNPTVSVARALEEAGHEVAWAAHEDVVRPLLPAGAEILSLGDAKQNAFVAGARDLRGLESLQYLWQELIVPLARHMWPLVVEKIAAWQPDVVICDQQAIGGALAARRTGTPWATFCTTSAGVTNPLAGLPKVQEWVDAQLAALEDDAGLPHVPTPDLSPTRVIVFSTEAMVGPLESFPAHFRFVGPSIADRPDATPFPFEALDPARRHVLVSLGTVSADRGGDFYATVASAFADTPWQIVLVAPDGRLASPPVNFIVRPRVPQLALLKGGHFHAVVSHGGHNTVCESLAHGVPLVVTPIRDDQPVIAEQVVRAGAGLRLKFGRLSPAALRDAIGRVLEEAPFAEAAARVQASFAAAGGAPKAASLLEELAS